MSVVAERLREVGFPLPQAPKALGMYVPAVRAGSLVTTSGQLPLVDGSLLTTGHVGDTVTPELAARCAAVAVLNALAAASTVCDLDEVVQVVRLGGFVASAPGFTGQPAVLNGASEVLVAAFGDAGRHSRCAVGVAELPLGAPVEVEVTLLLRQAT
jgi:enamine deaminase RidA (YjgF/YER057c/UK114 family)